VTSAAPDIALTRFILPPDAKVLPVAELSARVRSRIGAQAEGQSVVTRQGFRVTTRLVPQPLAELLDEFRTPSRLTDGVLRFATARQQDPRVVLEAAFEALATLVEARFLVPEDSPEAAAAGPSLVAGEVFAGYEIEAPVRSLEDSEVFRACAPDGSAVALKIARDNRPAMAAMLAHESRVLVRLYGHDTPAWRGSGEHAGRAYLAMTWCSGVSIGVAAQTLRAAGDRRRLHALVLALLQAYARLHARGVLHGDIHPGNGLLGDDGRVVLVDFGHARYIGESRTDVDITRAGIPQFYDPQMAQACRAGVPVPPASPESEQYAVAVLAYVMLTGLHPIDAPGVQDELLRRIAERLPLPFAARGVPAWPSVEAVLRRGLAREPKERFSDLTEMARSFAAAAPLPEPSSARTGSRKDGSERMLASVRAALCSLAPATRFHRDRAWLALRVAIALNDAEMLAVADLLTARAGRDPTGWMVAARMAHARSDVRAENRAISGFLAAARKPADGRATPRTLLVAACMLEGASPHCSETGALASWAGRQVRSQLRASPRGSTSPGAAQESALVAALALAKTGQLPGELPVQRTLQQLRRAGRGSVWLWALSHDVFADDQDRTLALEALLPASPLERGFVLLRRYQLTGEMRWLADAHRASVAASRADLPREAVALLAAELKMPENATPPPFASLFGRTLQGMLLRR
jgi:serine/threonine-protein kinase